MISNSHTTPSVPVQDNADVCTSLSHTGKLNTYEHVSRRYGPVRASDREHADSHALVR